LSYIVFISMMKAMTVDIKRIKTAVSWIFRIVLLIKIILTDY